MTTAGWPPIDPSQRGDQLPPAARHGLVAGVLGAHLVAGWALMQIDAVRDAVTETAPPDAKAGGAIAVPDAKAGQEVSMPDAKAGEEVATLGAGCYWCIEAVLQQIPGVVTITSGFAGLSIS